MIFIFILNCWNNTKSFLDCDCSLFKG